MGKEINLSRKTVTEDKDGNALITGKVSTEGAIVDAKDLTTKEYVDNAIAQASIGGEVDTSGFALKTEIPSKTSQLTNDSGFITDIPSEYVTSSELQQTLQPYDQELGELYDWVETDFAKKDDLFSGDYNDLTNKPCYDTRITERKIYTYTCSVSNIPENGFIKVSDDTYTIEEIRNFSNVTITFDYMDDTASKTYNCPMLSESDYSLFFFPDQSGNKNTACICNGIVYILLEDTENTSAGTYFRVQEDSDCIIEFSFDYLLSGEIKVLDEKYLANKPGRIVYAPLSDGSGDILRGEIFNSYLNRAGAFSHAEGLYTWALGDVSHSEGSYTKAMGSFSHAEGSYTEVMGSFSHAEGCYTIASGACQHVEGRGNIEDKNNKYLHIVGNGTDSDRSNAHTLDWNGNAWFAGKATVSVQPTDNNDLTTKLYVDQSISQVNNDLQNQINELFQNVSSGKELIASAITDKGVDASEEETFQSLSEKINQIPVGPPGSNIIGYVNENNDIYVSLTELESGTYTLKFEDYTGLLNEFDDIGTVEV